MKFESSLNNVYCNKICNNSSYDISYDALFGSNINLSNNYWCTTDSAIITSRIYDGFDDIDLGLVCFMPLDTIDCYLTAGIATNEVEPFTFSLYPNPAHEYITIQLNQNTSSAGIKIYSLLGRIETSVMLIYPRSTIDIKNLSPGVYIIEFSTEKGRERKKFVKQ
jgi:hypothetical protein